MESHTSQHLRDPRKPPTMTLRRDIAALSMTRLWSLKTWLLERKLR